MKFPARNRATPAAHPRPSARSGMSSGTGRCRTTRRTRRTSRHQEGVDDERMREDVLSEGPSLAQQAEAKPDGANCAIPVVQKGSAPLHPDDSRFAVLLLKITPNDARTVGNEWETKINYIAIAASEYSHR